MKTPNHFKKNLENGIVSTEMLSLALRSVNKRAKNYRDNEGKYRKSARDPYGNEEKNRELKVSMYKKKDKMLGLLNPIAIHKKTIKKDVIQKYDDNYDYEEYEKYINTNKVLKSRSYFDKEINGEVNVITVKTGEIEVKEEYFLYYKCGEYTFHKPIDKEEIKKNYADLKIEEINFETVGEDINDLLSMQFINKLIELIERRQYTLET